MYIPKKNGIVTLCLLLLLQPVTTLANQASSWTTAGTRAQLSAENISKTVIPQTWQDYNPPALYEHTVTLPRQYLTMHDGTQLAAYITLPADEQGNPIDEPLPTILVISDYNVTLGNTIGPPLGIFMGAADPYLVKRGYASISIDGRGTGNSEGTWDAWGSAQDDYTQIIDWVTQQPWSNGTIGLRGVSDLAINAMFAAETGHPAVKAVFAVEPIGDGYRDTAVTGGNANLFFLSWWFTLTTLMNTLNLDLLSDPQTAAPIVRDHLHDAFFEFQLPVFIKAALGDPELNYDSEFWRIRSPIERVDDIQAPTFLVGAVHDLFQRGVPAMYERLKNRVTTKMVILPGTHIEGAFATTDPNGVEGLPPFNHIELQWFDHYLKGIENGAEYLPQTTQYMIGLDQMAITSDWPAPEAQAQRYYLHGNGKLKQRKQSFFGMPRTLMDIWFAGFCSNSSSQWSLGILGLAPLPCFENNRAAGLFNLLYETQPFTADYAFNGPVQADIWVSTTGIAGNLSVRIDDIDPAGNATPISNGLINLKARRVDSSRSRTLQGETIQPWHPFTKDSLKPVFPGMKMKVSVEVFPTSAVIKAGHKLRVAVGPSNVPQGVATGLDGLMQMAPGLMTVYSDYWHPSSIVLPVVPVDSFRLVDSSQ